MVVIHAEPQIAWQGPYARHFSDGLKALGVPHEITNSQQRIADGLAILLGTSRFKECEYGNYLLVDRCSLGDTNKWVTLVRNGHGRRGEHRVPPGNPAGRWEWMEDAAGINLQPWRSGRRRVLCGQHDTWSPRYERPSDWYRTVADRATHFRRHPAADNPTALPETRKWDDVGVAITLNSSVAVDAVLAGVPTVTMDAGAMAWDVTGHTPDEIIKPPRLPWLHWLAWTQWSRDEISEGRPWEHLL